MSKTDKTFAGSIPAIYDRYLGPLIFEPYALDMAERAARLTPKRVLEVAAGTGIVTRALAQRLPAVPIVATDLNQPMLDHAAAHATAGSVTWRQADAQALPFEDGSFDLVVCQFGMMFFPDKAKGYGEARRVLVRGGHLVFNVWDRIAENEVADLSSRAIAALFPQDPPGFLSRTPYAYHDVAAISGAVKSAGFSPVHSEALEKRGRAPSPRDAAIGFCQGTPLRNEIEARDKSRLEEATEAAAAAISKRFGSGPVDSKIRAHVFEATLS